ncbi:hypothetical protein SLS60_010418 [Paraconiothyrium brasiliense]|uniref:Uncharacterized protein n=1 Tax=Paraconiothyrium brasiliense TaxID=300254 RepID=A0ABR3QNF6_9PLEO
MQRDHNILTETREIIVPLQPHEVKAGLNNSPGYRHHVFQCSGRSLWGLHPVSLRHLAMLGSDERAELLIQCEDIELHWDPVVPLDEKWRYRKTRESLKKHFGLQVGKPQKSVSDGKLPDTSASHDRRDTLYHPEHDDTSSPKHNHQMGSFFDQRAIERDRLLNLIAPRNTTHGDLARISFKTASEKELLRAAESFKTSADTIGKKLDFLPAVFEGKFSANPYEPRPQADKATASAYRLGGLAGTPPLKVTPEASRGTQVQEQRARMIEAKKSNSKSTTSVVHDDNSVADTSFSDFQRAVAAAAKDNPLSFASLITNWNLEPPPPKTPVSTGTREVSVNAPASNTDGEATIDTGPNLDDDAGTVESLEFLSDSEGGHSSHDSVEIESFLEVIDSINQENDNDHEELLDSKIKLPHAGGPGLGMLLQAGEKDIHQSTPNIEADAPLFPESTVAPTQRSASDDCHDADEEGLSEDQIEVTSAIVASDTGSLERMAPASSQTTHPSVSKGTQTPKALALIMPTFPLSTASEGSHEVMSSYAAQVLRKPSHRSVQNTPTSDRSIGTAPVAEPALDQELTASLVKNGKIGHDDTEKTPMDATARSRRKSKHALEDHNGNYPALSHDEHTVHSTSISEHLYLPPPHNFDAQPARHTSPKGSSYGRLDDPVFEAVVFPKNNGPELDAPLSLAFSDANVDDWAQDLVAAFHDHAISHALGDQHERPVFPVEDASFVVETAEVTSEETDAFQSKRNEGSPREQAISLVQVPGAVDGGEVTTPHVEAADHKPLKAHSSQENIHGNASSAGYDETTNQPLPIDTPAVNDDTATPTEWAELDHLASHRPPESGNLLDALLFYDDSLESNGIYPLHVPHPPPKLHHQSDILSYIWTAWEYGTYYFAAYIFVGVINPHMRTPRDLYLTVGVSLSGAWVVLRCLQSRSTETCGGVSSLKQVNKKGGVQRWVKVCGTMSGVVVVIAALVFGLWPVENAVMGITTTSTTTDTHTMKNATVLTALDDHSPKPITTSAIDTPISTTPEEPTTTSIPTWPLVMTDEYNSARGCCPEHGTESEGGSSAIPEHDSNPTTEDVPDSEYNSDSDFSNTSDEPQITPDSYGTSNSVVRVDPFQLSGPMTAVLISVPLGYLVKYSIWLWEMRDLTDRLR